MACEREQELALEALAKWTEASIKVVDAQQELDEAEDAVSSTFWSALYLGAITLTLWDYPYDVYQKVVEWKLRAESALERAEEAEQKAEDAFDAAQDAWCDCLNRRGELEPTPAEDIESMLAEIEAALAEVADELAEAESDGADAETALAELESEIEEAGEDSEDDAVLIA